MTVDPDSVAYLDVSLDPSSEYCYRVRAIGSGGPSDYAPAACATTDDPPVEEQFLRGDVDSNGILNALADSLFLLSFGFVPGSPVPGCLEATDVDGDGVSNTLSDALFALSFGFVPGSPPPPAPHPDCGPDPDPDTSLGCDNPPPVCNP